MQQQGRKRWRVAAVVLLVAAVVVAMLLTSGQMSELRRAVPPLSRTMSWLEGLPLPFDMDHVAVFAVLAVVLRLLLPRVRWWWLLLGLAALALATELLQFLTIGRTPKLLDARDDVVGAVVGLLAAACAIRFLGRCGIGADRG
jgi:hypothetical protein